jgi:uncharacterized protein (UPF0332 family)
MKGIDFLTLAESLAQEKTEAAWRTAVSRAYYAAFHVGRELFEDLGFTVPKAERAHGYLWLRLSNSGQSAVDQAGQDLKLLRSDRNFADYDFQSAFRTSRLADVLKSAKQIIRTLEDASMDPTTRTLITDTMKIYERDVLKNVTWHL